MKASWKWYTAKEEAEAIFQHHGQYCYPNDIVVKTTSDELLRLKEVNDLKFALSFTSSESIIKGSAGSAILKIF